MGGEQKRSSENIDLPKDVAGGLIKVASEAQIGRLKRRYNEGSLKKSLLDALENLIRGRIGR